MKFGGQIAVVAAGLVLASSGVVYPLHGSIAASGDEVGRLEAQILEESGVHAQLVLARAEMEALRERAARRDVRLCPATPEAQHAFESDLASRIEKSGLHSVRSDRKLDNREGRPALVLDMVVEGDAFALHKFLGSLEEMRWVTRVLALGVEPGQDVRRITIQIAVMLEQKS